MDAREVSLRVSRFVGCATSNESGRTAICSEFPHHLFSLFGGQNRRWDSVESGTTPGLPCLKACHWCQKTPSPFFNIATLQRTTKAETDVVRVNTLSPTREITLPDGAILSKKSASQGEASDSWRSKYGVEDHPCDVIGAGFVLLCGL